MEVDVSSESRKKDQGRKVNISELSELTGFSADFIRQELFPSLEGEKTEVSLEDLRDVMLSYIDKTMLSES